MLEVKSEKMVKYFFPKSFLDDLSGVGLYFDNRFQRTGLLYYFCYVGFQDQADRPCMINRVGSCLPSSHQAVGMAI
jgi:hypothetical protein